MAMIYGKADRALLCGYYDLLHGANDDDLSEILAQTEIDLLRKYHARAVAGVQFANLLTPDKYKKSLRRAMFQMFKCWQRGQPIPEPESFLPGAISQLRFRLA